MIFTASNTVEQMILDAAARLGSGACGSTARIWQAEKNSRYWCEFLQPIVGESSDSAVSFTGAGHADKSRQG
jgi:hypothetical protein